MKVRFIVLIDLSEYSAGLLQVAGSWTKYCNAEILVVHQTSPMTPAMLETTHKEAIVEIAENNAMVKLQNFVRENLSEPSAVKYEVSDNELTETISRLCNDDYENLVFVGIKGTGTLKKIFIGSVAVDIINEGKHITVAIPKRINTYNFSRIHIAVHQDHPVNIIDLDKFLLLTGDSIRSITFFSMKKEHEESHDLVQYLNELSSRYNGKGNISANYELYETDKVFDDIKNFMSTEGDELLIVQRGGRLFMDLVFRKFLINEIIYDGRIPLVVLP